MALQELTRGGPVTPLTAWKLGRTLKKNPALCFPGVEPKLASYTSEFTRLNGEEADPYAGEVDSRVVILAGEGKKHGRYSILDGEIEPITSLAQVRASCTSGSSSTRSPGQPRANVSTLQVCQFSPSHPSSVLQQFFMPSLIEINYFML